MKVPCSVIQDLLPLYHDNVCSPESCAMIEEHLKDCEACQEEFHRLEESPLPQAVKEEEEHKSQGLKKVKRTLRRRWVKVVAIAIVAVIVLSIPLGMWMNIPCFVEPADVVTDVYVQNDILTVESDSYYGTWVERIYLPDEEHPDDPQNGSILILQANTTPLNWITSTIQGTKEKYHQCFEFALTEEGWWEQNKDWADYENSLIDLYKRYPDQAPYPQDYTPPKITPETSGDFYEDVTAVYYYTNIDAGLWRKTPEEKLEDLDAHGILLWSAENETK